MMASSITLRESPVSITPLSADSKLDAVLKRKLNGDEQRLFAMHFMPYWQTNDCDNDFVIDVEGVYEWLGFTEKRSAKRALTGGLEEGVHYIIKATDVEGRGGQNKESILMTVNGFKLLCLSVKTARAEMVRRYYVALEGALLAYNKEIAEECKALAEESKAMLETERAEKEALRIEFDEHVERTKRNTNRKFSDGVRGNTTYIYKDSSDPKDLVYNVGETFDIAQREKEYSTHNSSGNMLYTKRCMNRKVLEKLVHHMLDQYRIMRLREWFDAPFDIIKDALDTAQAFMDGYVNRAGNMMYLGVGAKIRELIASVPRDDQRSDPVPGYVTADAKLAADKAAMRAAANAAKPDAPLPVMEPVVANKPKDYDAFIADTCILREDAFTLPAELAGAHRLWGRCSDEGTRNGLFKYLRDKFPRVKKEYPDGAVRLAHVGVFLKPLQVITEPTDDSTDIQRFLYSECIDDFVGRVSLKAIVERFESWKRTEGGDPECKLHIIDKRRLEDFLGRNFLRGTPCSAKGSEQGFFGLVFKDEEKPALRFNTNLRKRVVVLDPETQPATVVKTFDSVQECAAWFGVGASAITHDISNNRLRKGMIIHKVESEAVETETVKSETGDSDTSEEAPESAGPSRRIDVVCVDTVASGPAVKTNYAAFIADMCELRQDAKTMKAELMGAHRLWAKANDKETREGLSKYLDERFPRKKFPFPDGSTRICHVGVALKPLNKAITPPTAGSTEFQQFLHAECQEDFVGRVALKTLFERFEKWNNGYEITASDKRDIEAYLGIHFLRSHLCTGTGNELGYFGLKFKDDDVQTGILKNEGRKERVAVLDSSGKVVKIFESSQECCQWFNVSAGALSQDISAGRTRNGLMIRKVKDIAADIIEAYDPESAPSAPPGQAREKVAGTGQWRKKTVEEVDAVTGEVTQTFDTVKEAAEEASVESARMSTIISKGRNHGGFYYRFAATTAS